MGNDRIWQNTLPSRWKFQSTFPRGERLYTDMQKLIMFNFNPRSLVGNDHGETSKLSQSADFNPRSLVGNAYIPVGTYTIVEISIHVPSWGTTGFNRHGYVLFLYFNPRSLVGNDHGFGME